MMQTQQESELERCASSFHLAWKKFVVEYSNSDEVEQRLFVKRSSTLFQFWSTIAKEPALSKIKDKIRPNIAELIRLHQQHIIDPRWKQVDEHLRNHLTAAVKNSDKVVYGNDPVYQEFTALKEMHLDPWGGPLITAILSGKADSNTIDFFIGESFELCIKRLEILLEGNVPLIAYQLSEFLVSHVFDSSKNQSSLILRRWIGDASAKGHCVGTLLDVHLGLMYRLKKDSMQIHHLLKALNENDLISASERGWFRCKTFSIKDDEEKKSPLDGVWTAKTSSKAAKTISEFAMFLVMKKRFESDLVAAKVIQNWLLQFDDPKNSELDLDVEKYTSLNASTGAIYELAYQLYKKFGDDVRVLVVETFVRGFCCDVNRLDAVKNNKDATIARETEKVLSRGYILFSEVMKDNITMTRECILTAFSLFPSEGLLKQLTQLAEQSGFIDTGLLQADASTKDDDKRQDGESITFKTDNFEETCDRFVTSLSKGFSRAKTKFRANSNVHEKKERNLEGLVSIQGDLITDAANYDPVRPPLQTLTHSTLRLPKRLVADLLIVVEAPRWHLLSWVIDWHTLEERCMNLLKNPDIRNTAQELKYLVIDYTQFDEWSSDEEITATATIEKGYENWDTLEVEEDKINERGLSDNEEIGEFNIRQKLIDDDQLEKDEDEIMPDEYLSNHDENEEEKPITKDHFLVSKEESEAARSDLADCSNPVPGSLLHKPESNRENSQHEQSKEIIKTALTGLTDNSFIEPSNVEMELRPVHVFYNQLSFDPTSERVRQKLREVVPGLTDYSFWVPPVEVEFDAYVVHVTLAHPSNNQPSSSTSSTTANSQTVGQIRKVDQPNQSITEPSPVPIKKENERETKIQYVYKHGTQTIVVDRPLTEDELSKLKFPLPNNRIQATNNPAMGSNPGQPKDKPQAIVVARPPQPGSQSLPRVVVPSQSPSSVDTLANTLISQIQTPVQLTPSGQPIKTEDNPSPGTLPKFQFAFGQGSATIKTEPGLVAIKTEPQEMNGKVIMSPAQSSQVAIAQRGNLLAAKLGQPTSLVVPVVSNGATSLQNVTQSRIIPGQVTLQTTASPSAASHADLIRQLNLARAQGLVVLQQWGDKQVLVHKATGRWIMRQGNRLVTVPPQALGIQSSDQGTSTSSTTPTSTVSSPATSANLMSSSTMEQLREFDSILESKFKTTTSMSEDVKPVITTSGSPATFVIIAPQQSHSGTFGSGTPSIVKCEPVSAGLDFQQIKTLSSSSAPTSPSKPVKIPPSSVSASASPLGGSSAAFAKPSPKPQEDPDTLKRIQQILDDYNEQIRNSPDLQNRPAPRRRTNGPTIVNSTDPLRRKRLSSVSPPPSTPGGSDSDVGSPSVVQISPANVLDSSQIATLKLVQQQQQQQQQQQPTSLSNEVTSSDNMSGYSVVRQIVVPPSLAASLQASGRQIMVVTGPGGKKMVALKPIFVSSGSNPNMGAKFITVSAGGNCSPMTTRILTTSSASSSNASSPDTASNSASMTTKAIAALKSAVPVSIGSTSITSLSSPGGIRPPGLIMPMVSSSNIVVVSSPSVVLSSSSSTSVVLSSSSSTSSRPSPSPPLVMHSVGSEDRPGTPGLGIPMEMTPGQIMEAEISAATFLDDNPESPFALLSSASSSSLHRRKHEDEESLTETLPENLFTQDHQASSSEEDGSDFDMAMSHYGQRKRHLSSTSSDGMSQVHKRGRFIKINSLDPSMHDVSDGLRNRQGNLSQKTNQHMGISSQFISN